MSARLPLIDLHRHLEGSIRSSVVLDIAASAGHPLARLSRPRSALVAEEPLTGLLPYLAKVDVAVGALAALENWVRAASDVVDDAFDDGLDYLELRFSPGFIASETGLAREAVIDAVADGAQGAAHRRRMPVALVGIVVRDLGPESARQQMHSMLSRREGLCGVDLAGNEAGYPAELFASTFSQARDAGLHVTIHAGEAAGPQSVWAAVRHLGAERIGHGVRSVEDPRLLEYLADHSITLEVALTSNTQTGASPSLAGHQIHQILAAGVPVTVNTDDPRVSNVTLSSEHRIAVTEVGLTPAQLQTVADQSVRAAFTDLSGVFPRQQDPN